MLGHHGVSEQPVSTLRPLSLGPDSVGLMYSPAATRMHYDAAGQLHYWASMVQAEYTVGNGLKHFTALDDEPEYSTEH